MMLDRMEGNAELKSSVQLMLAARRLTTACCWWVKRPWSRFCGPLHCGRLSLPCRRSAR